MEITKSSLFMNARTAFLVLFVAMGVVAGAISLLWWGMSQVGLTAARIWALLITLLLPAVAVLCYRAGRSEARSHIAGMEDGISRVMQATTDVMNTAGNVADLRTTSVGSIRRSVQEPNVVVELPPAAGSYKLLESRSDGEVIEMD